MIVYAMTEGFAHDLRYEKEGYVLQAGEIAHAPGFSTLPQLETLHDPIAVKAKEDAEEAKQLRLQNLRNNVLVVELRNQLRTPEQISNYIDSNVDLTNPISIRTMFKRILLMLTLSSD